MPRNKKSTLLLLVIITALLPVAAQQPSTKLEDPEWIREIAPKQNRERVATGCERSSLSIRVRHPIPRRGRDR
jgi:hypothetical protein